MASKSFEHSIQGVPAGLKFDFAGWVVGSVLTATALFGVNANAEPRYRLTDMGAPAGFRAVAQDVNEFGQATGTTANAFLYSGGSITDLGAPPPFDRSIGNAINDSGTVVGAALNVQGDFTRAVVFSDGNSLTLGTLGGTSSFGQGINNAGQVTGFAQVATGARHAFVYSNGLMTDLGSLYGHSSHGYDINEAGQVAGLFFVGGNGVGAFLFDGATMIDLSQFGVRAAVAVNNQGWVTGNTYGNRAFIYNGSGAATLGTLGGSSSAGGDINDHGDVVGESFVAGDQQSHAFLYTDGQIWDLNLIAEPGPLSGWVLTQAFGINEKRQIVGVGYFNGVQRAFLATPVPEPSTYGLMLTGLCVLAFVARRQRRAMVRSGTSASGSWPNPCRRFGLPDAWR